MGEKDVEKMPNPSTREYEEQKMSRLSLRLRRLVTALHEGESAQDVIEYALMAGLVALGAVIGIHGVSNSINTAFSHVHRKVHTHFGKHLGWYK